MQKYYICINPSLSTVKKFYALLHEKYYGSTTLTHALIPHFEIAPKFKEAVDDNWNWSIKGFEDTDCIENIVEKGEIAHFSNFTFFRNVFLKLFSSFFYYEYIWRKELKDRKQHCRKKEEILITRIVCFKKCFQEPILQKYKIWIVWWRINSLPNDNL